MLETKQEYYKSCQLMSERNYKDGKLHGLSRRWHDNGKLMSEHYYKDGEYHGCNRIWYNDGQLESETYYWEGIELSSGAYEATKEESVVHRVLNRNW